MIRLTTADQVSDFNVVQLYRGNIGMLIKRIPSTDPNTGGLRQYMLLRPAKGSSEKVGALLNIGEYESVADYGTLKITPQGNGSITCELVNPPE